MDPLELAHWFGRPVGEWRERWAVPALRVFRRVGSTNDVAWAMARDGAGEGALVLAEEQTAGRGRRGRHWIAPPGASLSLSMVLRPDPEQNGLLTLRLGLAAADALESIGTLDVGLKWPNDLMTGGRKLGGILCEAEADADGRRARVIAGLGINLASPERGWPPEVRDRATSLDAAGVGIEPPDLVATIIDRWRAAATLSGPLGPTEQAAFDRRDTLRGRPVLVEGQPAGLAAGIGPGGELRVETDDGVRVFVSGTVRIQEFQGHDA